MVRAKWLASLNDGSTVIENEGDFVGDQIGSPWTKLQNHLKKNGFFITGMRIQVKRDGEAVRTYNMPSMGNINKDGRHVRWRFIRPIVPWDYLTVRRRRAIVGGPSKDVYIRCIAEYADFIVSLIVDLEEGTEASIFIHEKEKNNNRTA